MRFTDLATANVVIWGAGREGRAAAEACRRHGIRARVVVAGDPEGAVAPGDPAPPPSLAQAEAVAALEAADVVIKSPGVPVNSALFRALSAKGVRFTSGTDLWLSDHASQVIGVTGSKGKSTTSTLIHRLLSATGHSVQLAGNIGVPLLELEVSEDTLFVAELSSYQAQSVTVSPEVVVFTSLFPEHLPWHGGEDEYFRDKLNVAAHDPDLVVANGADQRLASLLPGTIGRARLELLGETGLVRVEAGGDVVWQDALRVAAADLGLPGRHNAQNLGLALATVVHAGLVGPGAADLLREVLEEFRGLEHRLERVPSDDGRRWYDDGLATAPEAVIAALSVFDDEEVALLFGGSDRGLSFDPLVRYLAGRAAPVHLLCLGPTGRRVAADLADGVHPVHVFETFVDALDWARSAEDPAPVVLLSPGAPSFNEFTDYAARSSVFRSHALGG